jgi:ABC-type amino acid transport substrate-binding protein
MKRRISLALLALISCWSAKPALAEEAMRYVHHADPAAGEARNAYSWRVLAAALERTRPRFGDYSLTPASLIDERPNATSLIKGEAGITVSVFTPQASYDDRLIPVRIPIDRGLLGFRILLIEAADQAKFAAVTGLSGLKSMKIGALVSWNDVAIMRHAGIEVVTGESFDGLFKMLAARRFDALSRGASEIERDYRDRRKTLPGIAIEQSLVLHYPMPVYFWFRNDSEGQRLAERANQGLREMQADGTLDALFHQEFDPLLKRLDLAHRHLIELENPLLPDDEPLAERGLWYDPRRR